MRDKRETMRCSSASRIVSQKKTFPLIQGGYTTQSKGNGNNPEPQIKKVYEPLDEERWVELGTESQGRELTFSEEVRQELEIIEEDEESNSN